MGSMREKGDWSPMITLTRDSSTVGKKMAMEKNSILKLASRYLATLEMAF